MKNFLFIFVLPVSRREPDTESVLNKYLSNLVKVRLLYGRRLQQRSKDLYLLQNMKITAEHSIPQRLQQQTFIWNLRDGIFSSSVTV